MADYDGFVCRLRGLPWNTSVDEVLEFFGDDVNIAGGHNGVHFVTSGEGRKRGEAFIELASEDDCGRALQKHKKHIGRRYIEVFRSKQSEMDWIFNQDGANQSYGTDDGVVRLKGVPFRCSEDEIAEFFTGLEIEPNGIMLPVDRQGRSTGVAYVQFASGDMAERALLKHKERIGHRYIEIYESTLDEATASMTNDGGRGGYNERQGGYNERQGGYNERQGGYNERRGGYRSRQSEGQQGSRYVSKTGHSVRMKGMPFQAQESDVIDFFRPLSVVNIQFGENRGRPSGDADVDFETHGDAVKAMKRNRAHMQHRYVELFLNSTPEGGDMDG